jgi:hypothetical protein
MRRSGDQYSRRFAETAPNVLSSVAELIAHSRELQRPVNYTLVRVIPSKDVEIDVKHRPLIVGDPPAGHGPAIGRFKADSEMGVAMEACHPCYFIGFLPDPMPGQTALIGGVRWCRELKQLKEKS